MFKLINSEKIKEIDSVVKMYEHKKTKARVMYIESEDTNKTFGIGFKTPSFDSTGVQHILEHSVLCGSRKFPLKDPFVELAKGSLNTFLNAMTYPDKTLYPISSQNDTDFRNLMDVYLDAVFFPNIYKTPYLLMQEGWRFDLEDIDAPLEYKGVVYNEMKGAFSSPEQLLFTRIDEGLFPNSPYQYESGGMPEDIIDLTYENYIAYHKKYYHPSNCYICLYGNIDIKETLHFIDKEYLSHFDYQEINSQIPMQPAFDKVVEKEYAYSVNEEKGNQLYLSYNFVIGESTDRQLMISFDILDYILLTTPASPLKKALIKEGIGEDVFGVFQTHLKQPIFSIVAKNVSADKEQRFYELVEENLNTLCKKGIPKDLIDGAMQVKEFNLHEGESKGYSKGLIYFIGGLKSWLYGKDPTDQFKYEKIFENLKQSKDNKYFEGLIKKYILDNKHCTKVKLYPEKNLDAKIEKATEDKLAKIKASLSKEQLEGYVKRTKDFKIFQETPDSEKDKMTIPILKKEELEIEPMYPNYKVIKKDKVDYIVTHTFTNQICYLNWYINLDDLDDEHLSYIGTLVGVLGKLDTKNYNYENLSSYIDQHLGGIDFYIKGIANVKQKGKNERNLLIKTKALTKHFSEQLAITKEILTTTKFDDLERLLEILKEIRSFINMALASDGHKVAISRLLSHFTPLQEFEEKVKGLDFYHFIEDIIDNWETKKEEFSLKLTETYKLLCNVKRITIGITIDKAEVDSTIEKIAADIKLLPKNAIKSHQKPFKEVPIQEGLVFNGTVNYVAQGYNFKKLGFEYTGSMLMLKTILSMDYLWNNVRVKNGAYGCFSDFRKSGNMFFVSYRDPNVAKTLDIYKKVVDYIKDINLTERQLVKYLIGTISTLDFPYTPSTEGDIAQLYCLSNTTKDDLAKVRGELFDTTNEILRSFAPILQAILDQNQYCVFGNKTSIEQNKDIFENIINI
ncbi:peptidase M16 [Candidatus Epulonipiscium fishelsonii]|uniref:Peptidase M16 n=1 Tax=Candidatus Epulonipiscium fishelsonii TaxID=77094 RepID=A0ACC8XBB1_9FIRM|nr:peptidase M16 [Epulopiscium sp. SCG-B05WGA-EpuloA1]ONI39694.1 peptidase M16 [Epulopiscium sp. SCG-B11WGA-EpuloA1]